MEWFCEVTGVGNLFPAGKQMGHVTHHLYAENGIVFHPLLASHNGDGSGRKVETVQQEHRGYAEKVA